MLLPRPPYQLESLQPKHRWEVIRRHPWYQLLWQIAAREFDGELTMEGRENDVPFRSALGALWLLGVSGKPPDPATEFDSLCDPAISPMWLAGAVRPLIIRTLIANLILSLPRESLASVATFFNIASQLPTDDEDTRAMALVALNRVNEPSFDKFPVAPIVRLNPAASERELVQALRPLLKQWKADRELTERRNRPEMIEKYLEVWDLREGWKEGRYMPNELQIQQIARKLRLATSTVDNYYRCAFELVVGHPFSRERWFDTCGPLRLTTETEQPAGKVSQARPRSSSRKQEVPFSRLTGGRPFPEQINSVSDVVDAARVTEQITQMIAGGLDDDRILEELDYNETARRAVEYLRSKYEGGPRPEK